MKYLIIIVFLFFAACKSGGYQMKITYMVNKTNGGRDVIRYQRINAANDSLAYVAATHIFQQKIERNDSTKAQADHFDLYNAKGALVKRTNP